MTSRNIGYHTRAWADGTKVCGGSFGGSINQETVERLVKAHFKVIVKPSGRPVFVDRMDREVHLYIAVDPRVTKVGMEALCKWQVVRRAVLLQAEAEEKVREIEELLDSLSHEEIVRRLKG